MGDFSQETHATAELNWKMHELQFPLWNSPSGRNDAIYHSPGLHIAETLSLPEGQAFLKITLQGASSMHE